MDRFTLAYIEAALWSSVGDNEENLDKNYYIKDISEGALTEMIEDCERFQRDNEQLLKELDPEYSGHDFWLTRNHHGAGFWDRGYGEIGNLLTEAAHKYAEVELYVGDDNRIYSM